MMKIKNVAEILGLENGYRVVINCGEDGMQERGKGFTGRAGKVLSSPTSADVLKQEGNNFKSTATLARWTGAISEDSLPYRTVPDKPASDYPNQLHLRDISGDSGENSQRAELAFQRPASRAEGSPGAGVRILVGRLLR